MPTYRAVPDERIDDFRSVLQYAFSPAEAPETYESVADLPKPARLGARRGLFDGDELRCTCAHHWFTTTVRGGEHPLAGLSAVATPPENRRQGLIARLLRESLAEYRERDQYLAALWPFAYAFYRQYGWAQAGRTAIYECDPEALSFAADDGEAPSGEFRRLNADDFEELNSVLTAAGEGVSLWMRRTEEWWRNRVFAGWETDPYVYGVERDGNLRGYIVYDVEADDDRTCTFKNATRPTTRRSSTCFDSCTTTTRRSSAFGFGTDSTGRSPTSPTTRAPSTANWFQVAWSALSMSSGRSRRSTTRRPRGSRRPLGRGLDRRVERRHVRARGERWRGDLHPRGRVAGRTGRNHDALATVRRALLGRARPSCWRLRRRIRGRGGAPRRDVSAASGDSQREFLRVIAVFTAVCFVTNHREAPGFAL